MRENTKETEGANGYFSWRPGEQPQFEWAVTEDLQEIVAEGSGFKLATVQEGFVAPMAEWKVLLREFGGGGACILSESDLDSYSREMMQVGSRALAPKPSIDGNRLVWAERFVANDGTKAKRIVLFDLASAKRTTLAEVRNVNESDVWSPSVSGSRVGWMEQPPGGAPAAQVVLSLDDNTMRRYELAEQPIRTALLDEGKYLALALREGQFAVDLANGTSVKVSSTGTWLYSSGRFSSWPPATGYVGYYDAREKVIHLVDTRGAETVGAYVMGDFFVWQEFHNVPKPGGSGGQTMRESKFYAIRLEGT
jgi:hypothetical protein